MSLNPYALLFLALVLTGCDTVARFVARPAVPENCEASCRVKCTVPADLQFVEPAGPYNAADEITQQVVNPLLGIIEQCDTHRAACVQCLDRLKDAGVTE